MGMNNSAKREFDCLRDTLRIAGIAIRLNEDDVASLHDAETTHLLPFGFFEQSRNGMDRKVALAGLLGAMRKCVGPRGGALVDLLAIVIGPEARQNKPKRNSTQRIPSASHKGLTPNGRLFRR